jgi:hypothetical protein
MQIHGRAKLGPAGRLALCEASEGGMTFRQAAACLNVSPARTPVVAPLSRSFASRATLPRLGGRSVQPSPSLPRLLSTGVQERICEARRHTGWGPRLVAGATGQPHSTVWKVLRRHGTSRRPRQPRAAPQRYEWPCPGDLLHMDCARNP